MKCNWTKPLLLLSLLGLDHVYGQTTFNTIEYLDINRFNIRHMVHGDMWYDATTGQPGCEYPKGSGRHASYMAGIWTTAADASGNNDYAAVQLYRSGGSDFWPGPLDAADTCTYASSEKWARIWKVNQADIVAFRALTSRTTTTVPTGILEWPAKGNPYAKGNAGAGLSISEDMAPFTDVDGDGVYDPLKGDYPKIKGDQMLWWIFNDNGATPHVVSKGKTMKLEYRVRAYAYSRGGKLDNIVYYEFDIVNKSSVKYVDFRAGIWSDADLGYSFDDYIASDSARRMGILYNATIPDGANGANSYGDHPPMVGFSLVEVPGDAYPADMQPAGAFSYFENTLTGKRRDPHTPSDFRNYMHGWNADAELYPDSPLEFPITKGAVMCTDKYPLSDRRFFLNSDGFDFEPGATKKLALVLMATDTVGYACDALDFKALTDVADSAWKVYYNPLSPLSTKEFAILDAKLRIYPNPAQSVVMIDSYMGRTLKAAQLKVYDAAGRQVQLPVQQSSKQLSIDVSSLAAGVYSLVYGDGEVQATQQFVKQ